MTQDARLKSLGAAVEHILRQHPAGLSEHEMFQALAATGERQFARDVFADRLTLFRAHFLLFHVLYQLRDTLRSTGRGEVLIGCLHIALVPYRQPPATSALACRDRLAEYYRDLGNLGAMSASQLDALLEAFWQRFGAQTQKGWALGVLGLDAAATAHDIRRRYRALAMTHHPDRGGDAAVIKELNQAMAVLKPLYAL